MLPGERVYAFQQAESMQIGEKLCHGRRERTYRLKADVEGGGIATLEYCENGFCMQ